MSHPLRTTECHTCFLLPICLQIDFNALRETHITSAQMHSLYMFQRSAEAGCGCTSWIGFHQNQCRVRQRLRNGNVDVVEAPPYNNNHRAERQFSLLSSLSSLVVLLVFCCPVSHPTAPRPDSQAASWETPGCENKTQDSGEVRHENVVVKTQEGARLEYGALT